MRRLIPIVLFLFAVAVVLPQQYMPNRRKALKVSAPAPVTYLLEENCEGTGTPVGWTDSGTMNWDYTSTVLEGSQSTYSSYAGSTYTLTGIDEVYGYCLFQVVALPVTSRTLIGFDMVSDYGVCDIIINSTGNVKISGGSYSAGAVSTGQKYHLWFSFIRNGTCTVAFSTDGVRPTVGDNTATLAGANYEIVKIVIGPASGNMNNIKDRILVNNVQIGDNP